MINPFTPNTTKSKFLQWTYTRFETVGGVHSHLLDAGGATKPNFLFLGRNGTTGECTSAKGIYGDRGGHVSHPITRNACTASLRGDEACYRPLQWVSIAIDCISVAADHTISSSSIFPCPNMGDTNSSGIVTVASSDDPSISTIFSNLLQLHGYRSVVPSLVNIGIHEGYDDAGPNVESNRALGE